MWAESHLEGDLEMPASTCELAVVSTHVEGGSANQNLCHALSLDWLGDHGSQRSRR